MTNRTAPAPLSITFVSRERSRADYNFGAVDLVRRETVHADGRVEWSVVGESDGERVDSRGVRLADASLPLPLDLASVTAARLRSGWMVSQ